MIEEAFFDCHLMMLWESCYAMHCAIQFILWYLLSDILIAVRKRKKKIYSSRLRWVLVFLYLPSLIIMIVLEFPSVSTHMSWMMIFQFFLPARNIHRILFKTRPSERNELFLPKRMAYVVEIDDEFNDTDIPTTLIRSKADCPTLEVIRHYFTLCFSCS